MTRTRVPTVIPAALALGLALGICFPARGQLGPGLSSGSGEGTGTGFSSGIQNNRSGSVSGVGPPSSLGRTRPRGGLLPDMTPGDRRFVPRNSEISVGSGIDAQFPDDSSLFPFSMESQGGMANPADLVKIQTADVEAAKRITDPGERTLGFQRMARVAIFNNQHLLAHEALREAAQSAVLIPDPIIRDLRIMAIIYTLNNLSDAHLREGKLDLGAIDTGTATPALPARNTDLATLIDRADVEWRRAAYLASRLTNTTYRNEMLYRVVDNEAYGSETIINEFPQEESAPGRYAKPGEKPARPSTSPLTARADKLLAQAADVAWRIERPVWRDRALVSVAYAASASRQFNRGLQVARTIPQPEVRTDALMRIAEAQSRLNDPAATHTYREAAEAVAAIPLDDPRAVLTGVLIDSLVSAGRFEDARATVSLYPDNARRLTALGAIAQSQGFRGAADSASQWIARDVPIEYRATLYRRVHDGALLAIEENRSKKLSGEAP